VIGILAASENVFPPLPADTVIAIGAFLSNEGVVSLGSVIGVTWGANALSAIVVYLVARRWGRPLFKGPLGRRLIKPKAMARLERAYERHGVWGVFGSRFIPGVRAVVPPFAGIVGLKPRQTVIPLLIASLLWYGTLAILAATLIPEVEEIARVVRTMNIAGLAAGLGVLLFIVVAAVFGIKKRRR